MILVFDANEVSFLNPTTVTSSGVTNAHGFSQQHTGLHCVVFGLLQDVTRPKAQFKPTLHEKSVVDWGASRGQHILVS